MRHLDITQIQKAIYKAICEISFACDSALHEALQNALEQENDKLPRDILETILLNHKLAQQDHIPLCQDTGSTVVIAEIGQELHIQGGSLIDAINNATAAAQKNCPLRASIVKEPLFERDNSSNNCPAIIHFEIVPGSELRLLIAQKGGGAENMSFMKMHSPALDEEGLINYVVDGVLAAGSRPCPPLILGIGIGGNFEQAPLMAKKALFRDLGSSHADPRYQDLESIILKRVNKLGCGAQGFGGKTTALAVHIISAPCHIASLPVAVNIQCHAHRHKEIVL